VGWGEREDKTWRLSCLHPSSYRWLYRRKCGRR